MSKHPGYQFLTDTVEMSCIGAFPLFNCTCVLSLLHRSKLSRASTKVDSCSPQWPMTIIFQTFLRSLLSFFPPVLLQAPGAEGAPSLAEGGAEVPAAAQQQAPAAERAHLPPLRAGDHSKSADQNWGSDSCLIIYGPTVGAPTKLTPNDRNQVLGFLFLCLPLVVGCCHSYMTIFSIFSTNAHFRLMLQMAPRQNLFSAVKKTVDML